MNIKLTAKQLIEHFQLLTHPEGGYYKENYRSQEQVTANALPARFDGDRSFSTAIYFLLETGNFSAFHRIKSDECWHFYAGGRLLIYVITADGDLQIIKLGSDISAGELFQYVVPAGCWFASESAPGVDFSFVGCTVSPGFDFEDFEMAEGDSLSQLYPHFENEIKRLSR